jgi:hypothetical protein
VRMHWKILVIANLLGLIFLSIYSSDKNLTLKEKMLEIDDISRRLIRETNDLKTTNRKLIEVSNQLKFRIERLEFESGEDTIEDVAFIQYENISSNDEPQELENNIPPSTKVYRYNIERDTCVIPKEWVITLVASGFGELAHMCSYE